MGWQPAFFWAEENGELAAGAMVLLKTLPWKIASLAVISSGPFWLPGRESHLPALLDAVGEHCRSFGAVFCRINIPCPQSRYTELKGLLPTPRRELASVWSYWNFPRAVMAMDITGSREDVLARMHPDTRNKTRRSQRRGMVIRRGSQGDVATLSGLMQSLGKHKQVLVREPGYFETLFAIYPDDRTALFLGEADGRCVAAFLGICLGPTVWDLYSAFDWSYRRLYPNEALHLALIEWAREAGCKTYDMGGTCTNWPPHPSDKGFGVYTFKKRLGGRQRILAPYCDLIYRPALYRAAFLAENVGIPLTVEKGLGKLQVGWKRLRTELGS